MKKSNKKIRARYKAKTKRNKNLEFNVTKQAAQSETALDQSTSKITDQREQREEILVQGTKSELNKTNGFSIE